MSAGEERAGMVTYIDITELDGGGERALGCGVAQELAGVLRPELFVELNGSIRRTAAHPPRSARRPALRRQRGSPAEPRPVGMTVAGAAGAYLRAGDSEAEDSALR
jgi:hypothetical protein